MDAIRKSFKTILDENEGELGYWGERLLYAPAKKEAPSVVTGRPSPSLPPATPPAASSSKKAAALARLFQDTIGDCHRCPLGDTRQKIVFGVGNPEARVMFVGEGPGFDEDRRGEPFVGKAGQLLDKILASIALSRTTAYIANVVKCHPMKDPSSPDLRGNDRAPDPTEMTACLPFLLEQIRIIRPAILVTLGAVATKALLNRSQGISALRGKIYDMPLFPDEPAVKILPTFHPAALLRDENLKRDVWKDMLLLRQFLVDNPAS